MGINRYELEGIAYIRADGPMWATTTDDGKSALLTLHTQKDADQFLERWKNWASITHPHIVQLLDVVSHEDGRWALIQERISGDSLALHLENSTELLRIHKEHIRQALTDALTTLHSHHIIHGDLTPANIIITPEGNPVIIDLIGESAQHNGTPGWSSKNISIEEDNNSLERILHALNEPSPTPHLNKSSDPGIRLRAHSQLPITERQHAQRRWTAITRPTPRREYDPQDPTKRPQRSPLRILLIGATASGMIGIWGATNMWAASEYAPPPPEAIEYTPSTTTQPHTQESTPSPQSQQQSQYSVELPLAQSTPTLAPCPQQNDIIAAINNTLALRDKTYNGENADLETVLDPQLLARDRATMEELRLRDTHVRGFHTHLHTPTLIECSDKEIHIDAQITTEAYTICHGGECQEVAASRADAPAVRLILNLEDLKLVRVEEKPQPAPIVTN